MLLALFPGVQGFVDDVLERNAVLGGAGVAVLILGLGVEDDAVERGGLDADFAVRSGDGGVCAVEGAALLGAGADAERGGLAEEKFFEARRVGGAAEDGEQGADAAFLHHDGGGHDVERAVFEGELRGVRDDLRAEVVDGAFEDGDVFARDGVIAMASDGFADAEAQDVGKARWIARAGAVADVLEGGGGARELAVRARAGWRRRWA